ncbi:MAG: glycosyltransferase [Candidatus Aenigmatarchaeota archaeon]
MKFVDIFYVFANFISIYLSLVWFIVYFNNKDKFLRKPKIKNLPSVTFLVPAFNEEKNIARCLKSLIDIDYPKNKKKIIVINDGSTDRTSEIVKMFKKFKVRLIEKKNEGKAVALNYAMKFVNTDLVSCIDADSFVERDFLKKTTGYFKSMKVGAVTSAIKVDRTDTLMEKIQWVEYIISIILRKLFSVLGCQFVVSGAGGIYRTEVLKKVGLFKISSITEDTEIGLRLRSRGYDIENCIDSYVYTSSPKSFKSLFNQRMRWYRGYIENIKEYLFLINPKYGDLGVFFIPVSIMSISLVVILFLLVVGTTIYDSLYSIFSWSLINNQIIIPSLSIDIFQISFLSLLNFLALATSITLIFMGIRLSKVKFIKRKFLYIGLYFLIYPFLLPFLWLSVFILELRKADKKW